MFLRLIVGLAVVLLMTACRLPGSSSVCTAQIDWVDFVQVGGTQYVAAPGSPTTLSDSDLGRVVAHVKFKLAGNVCDPNYRPKDGDAAYLESGTPIYEVAGHLQSQLLAAWRNGRIESYEPITPGG